MNTKMSFCGLLRLAKSTQAFFGAVCVLILGVGSTTAFGSSTTGLDFPGSTGTTVRFRFTNPLPIYPAAYIWRAKPRAQPADWPTSSQHFYTTFFWSNDVAGSGVGPTDGTINNSVFQWDGGSANTYYGAHPYPQGTPDGGNPPNYGAPFTASTVKCEIATDGFDWTSDQSVVFDQWYTQAFVAWADENGFKHTAFYWDLSDPTKVITHTTYPSYGNTMPPVPALTFGDAPWHQGWEVYDGILRGIRVYSTNLSLSDIQKEADSPLSTDAGKTSIWYLNMNPTPDDISDKSGKGHNPSWIGSARPSLYSVTEGPPPNTPVGSPTVQLTDPANGAQVSVSFASVTQPGVTTLTASASGLPLPPHFNLRGSAYKIDTTATFAGTVTVCVNMGVNPTTARTVRHDDDDEEKNRDRHNDGHGRAGEERDHRDDDHSFPALQLVHYVNGVPDQSFESFTQNNSICGRVTSLGLFGVVQSDYKASIQQPINARGTSVFHSRSVVPVKFRLSLNGEPTCRLPAATITVFRIGETAPVGVNESDFLAPSDSGSTFRIDSSNCQYMYHLNSRSLEEGSYSTQIRVSGIAVGSAVFGLR